MGCARVAVVLVCDVAVSRKREIASHLTTRVHRLSALAPLPDPPPFPFHGHSDSRESNTSNLFHMT